MLITGGNIGVVVFNHGREPLNVSEGEAIAQLILDMNLTPEVQEVPPEELTNTVRGTGGFGSTVTPPTPRTQDIAEKVKVADMPREFPQPSGTGFGRTQESYNTTPVHPVENPKTGEDQTNKAEERLIVLYTCGPQPVMAHPEIEDKADVEIILVTSQHELHVLLRKNSWLQKVEKKNNSWRNTRILLWASWPDASGGLLERSVDYYTMLGDDSSTAQTEYPSFWQGWKQRWKSFQDFGTFCRRAWGSHRVGGTQ